MTDAITVTAPVWLWNGDKGSWHFLTIGEEAANHIRFDSMGLRGGFGSVKVIAAIGDVEWQTSVFPSGDDYVLPIKADVRRRANVMAGSIVTVRLQIAARSS